MVAVVQRATLTENGKPVIGTGAIAPAVREAVFQAPATGEEITPVLSSEPG